MKVVVAAAVYQKKEKQRTTKNTMYFHWNNKDSVDDWQLFYLQVLVWLLTKRYLQVVMLTLVQSCTVGPPRKCTFIPMEWQRKYQLQKTWVCMLSFVFVVCDCHTAQCFLVLFFDTGSNACRRDKLKWDVYKFSMKSLKLQANTNSPSNSVV